MDVPSVGLTLGAVFLGHALQILDGRYDPIALVWLTLALGAATVGITQMRAVPRGGAVERWICALLGLSIAWQIGSLLSWPPGVHMKDYAHLSPFYWGIALQAVVIVVGPFGAAWMRRAWFPVFLAIHLALGVWMILQSPSPFIDVVVVTRAAIRAALRWRDPYAITIPNIYGPDTAFYRPEVLSSYRVLIGYPYPPLSLLLAIPGQSWFGDYRYSHLAANVVSATLMGYIQPGLRPKLAGALFLTTPRIFYVLEQGWSEPVAILLFVITVFCLVRRPRAVPWVAGLFLVVKQYLVFAVPLVWRLSWKSTDPQRFRMRALTAALALTLPWALRHPLTFVENVVLLQAREPSRIDSLSYISWAARAGWGAGTLVWAVGAAIIGVTVGLVMTPNTAAGFAASVGFFCLLTFAFGSKAFANYYFLVIAAFCCAVAARQPGDTDDSTV
jgi:hypothetical protein